MPFTVLRAAANFNGFDHSYINIFTGRPAHLKRSHAGVALIQ